jgi:hypothetical protein
VIDAQAGQVEDHHHPRDHGQVGQGLVVEESVHRQGQGGEEDVLGQTQAEDGTQVGSELESVVAEGRLGGDPHRDERRQHHRQGSRQCRYLRPHQEAQGHGGEDPGIGQQPPQGSGRPETRVCRWTG